MAQIVGSLGSVETLTIAGRTFVNPNALIPLQGWCSANTHCTLRRSGATSGYQVTSGKTLTIDAMRVFNGAQTGILSSGGLAQIDVDIGMSSSTAFTNPVNMSQSSLSGPEFGITVSSTLPGPMFNEFSGMLFPVAATKFVGAYLQTGMTIWAWGYET